MPETNAPSYGSLSRQDSLTQGRCPQHCASHIRLTLRNVSATLCICSALTACISSGSRPALVISSRLACLVTESARDERQTHERANALEVP